MVSYAAFQVSHDSQLTHGPHLMGLTGKCYSIVVLALTFLTSVVSPEVLSHLTSSDFPCLGPP